MKNDIKEAERMVSHYQDEITRCEHRRDRSVAMQGQLVDRLEPEVKAFMRISRMIRLPEEGEPSSKRQRRS